MIFSQPPHEWLRLVGEHQSLWRWSTILFIAGTIVTLMGAAGLTALLQGARDPGFAQLGLLAFAVGAALWIVTQAARLTVEPWAAKALADTGAIPDVYTAVTLWTGALFVIYTILTFAGLSLYGGGILTSTLLPGWAGWIAVIYGVVGLIAFAVVRDMPPFVHYLMPIVIGTLLLVQ
jgi:hypothetical protein